MNLLVVFSTDSSKRFTYSMLCFSSLTSSYQHLSVLFKLPNKMCGDALLSCTEGGICSNSNVLWSSEHDATHRATSEITQPFSEWHSRFVIGCELSFLHVLVHFSVAHPFHPCLYTREIITKYTDFFPFVWRVKYLLKEGWKEEKRKQQKF